MPAIAVINNKPIGCDAQLVQYNYVNQMTYKHSKLSHNDKVLGL